VIILILVLVPRIIQKLRDTGVLDQVLDKFGGEKLRMIQFERQISLLKKNGDILGAAQLYEDAEWYPEAINLYLEAEEFIAAGTLYEKLEQWDRAADAYGQADDWKRAANIFAEIENPGKAAELYEEHGQKIDAAKLYFEAGRFDRAAELYEDVSYFPQAAKSFENLGEHIRAAENYEKHWSATTSFGGGGLISASSSDRQSKVAERAGELFEKGGDLDRAADIYDRAGLAGKAADLAVRTGRFGDAAEMLLKEEKLEEAAQMFDKAGNSERAALLRGEVAFHQGENQKAAEEFLKGGDPLRAAELFEGAGDLASAANCYEQSDSPLQAANVYLRADMKEKAADMFERGNDFRTAARMFEQSGHKDRASALYEKAELHFEAGKLACELGENERGIQLLQKIDPESEHYEAATLILSRLFIEKDLASLAVEKLSRVLGDRPISAQTLEHFYYLGRAYESTGKTREAISTYKKVMAERYGYEDVEQRLARLASQAPQATAQPAAPAAPPPGTKQAVLATTGYFPPAAKAPGRPAPAKSPIQVTQELGRGLLGETYKGVDTRNGRPVAVKFLRNDLLKDKTVVKRLLAEARLARSLHHPSLVRLLGLTEIDGRKAAVMEFVEGFDLAALMARSKRLTIKQGLDLLSTLCIALGHAHQNKILHLDLKMTNVLVTKGGKLKLAGLGLGALRIPALPKADGYPSPELVGGLQTDARSDIYSLGGMIFHGLSGQHPSSQQSQPNGAPALRQLLPEIPEPLDKLVSRCLAEDPAARFSTVAEVLAAARPLRA
jgi:tetratricopeptide (TPR) repeat protein